MKKYEKVMIQTNKLVEHICDACGSDIRTPKGFDFSRAEFSASIGPIYTECPSQTHYELELCTKCFEKAKEILEINEFVFREWDD